MPMEHNAGWFKAKCVQFMTEWESPVINMSLLKLLIFSQKKFNFQSADLSKTPSVTR